MPDSSGSIRSSRTRSGCSARNLLERLPSIGRGHDAQPVGRERLSHRLADGRLVLHDQDGPLAPDARRSGRVSLVPACHGATVPAVASGPSLTLASASARAMLPPARMPGELAVLDPPLGEFGRLSGVIEAHEVHVPVLVPQCPSARLVVATPAACHMDLAIDGERLVVRVVGAGCVRVLRASRRRWPSRPDSGSSWG